LPGTGHCNAQLLTFIEKVITAHAGSLASYTAAAGTTFAAFCGKQVITGDRDSVGLENKSLNGKGLSVLGLYKVCCKKQSE